jgi:phosphoribosylanthranilate isomerase
VADTWERYVKICGVTTVRDARMVAASGASALGLIYAESPRRVTIDQSREIVRATDGDLLRCAVFRYDEDAFILERLDAVPVEIVQLHGDLGERLLEGLRARTLLVVKALNIEHEEFDSFDETRVDAVMIDGAKPGSGVEHSWDRLERRSFRVPVIAAGGLNPDNVEEIVAVTGASGVDCSSGVESSPGRKDPERVKHFVANATRALSKVETP